MKLKRRTLLLYAALFAPLAVLAVWDNAQAEETPPGLKTLMSCHVLFILYLDSPGASVAELAPVVDHSCSEHQRAAQIEILTREHPEWRREKAAAFFDATPPASRRKTGVEAVERTILWARREYPWREREEWVPVVKKEYEKNKRKLAEAIQASK